MITFFKKPIAHPSWFLPALCCHVDGLFILIIKVMSKAEYKRLLEMEIEQLDTCRETSHNRYHEVVDKPIRKLDSDLLIAIARDRIDVGLDLTSEDRNSVEKELGL